MFSLTGMSTSHSTPSSSYRLSSSERRRKCHCSSLVAIFLFFFLQVSLGTKLSVNKIIRQTRTAYEDATAWDVMMHVTPPPTPTVHSVRLT